MSQTDRSIDDSGSPDAAALLRVTRLLADVVDRLRVDVSHYRGRVAALEARVAALESVAVNRPPWSG